MKGASPFWTRWLVVVSFGVMVFGLLMVLLPGLTLRLFGLLFFSSSDRITGFSGSAVSYITLVHGVLGATMFGWGTAMLLIVLGPFRRAAFNAWMTLAVSLAAWFIPDTAFSLWSGFWQNAVLNCAFIVLFAVPLAATYRSCRSAPSR